MVVVGILGMIVGATTCIGSAAYAIHILTLIF